MKEAYYGGIQRIKEYRRFTGPAELHKAVNTLRGIVAGITMDSEVDFWDIIEDL